MRIVLHWNLEDDSYKTKNKIYLFICFVLFVCFYVVFVCLCLMINGLIHCIGVNDNDWVQLWGMRICL
jgi:hypothetical protein